MREKLNNCQKPVFNQFLLFKVRQINKKTCALTLTSRIYARIFVKRLLRILRKLVRIINTNLIQKFMGFYLEF